MTDLDDRLREGITALAERYHPTTVGELVATGDEDDGARVPVWRSPRALAVAAGVVVVALVAAVIVVSRSDDAEEGYTVDVAPPQVKEGWDPSTLGVGWHDLPPSPLGAIWPHAMVWTGSELILWRGVSSIGGLEDRAAAFDPMTNTWELLPPDPLPDAEDSGQDLLVYMAGSWPGGAWTGSEALFWAANHLVAWNPDAGAWRTASSPPSERTHAGVWTGEEVLFFLDGLAYAPGDDEWRRIAEPPTDLIGWIAEDSGAVHWTGDALVVVGHGSALYDPTVDRWTDLGPPLTVETGSPSGETWDGYTAIVTAIEGRIVAFDSSPTSAVGLDLDSMTWVEQPSLAPPVSGVDPFDVLPLDDGRVVIGTSDEVAVGAGENWSTYAAPGPGRHLGVGDAVFLYGHHNSAPHAAVFVPPGEDVTSLPRLEPFSRLSFTPGWHELGPTPVPPERSVQVATATSHYVLLFGLHGIDDTVNRGFQLDLSSGQWTEIPPAPIEVDHRLAGEWNGEELIAWSAGGVAAWNPYNQSWRRTMAPPPRPIEQHRTDEEALLAGDAVVYWADGLAYDVSTDEWREITRPPQRPARPEAVFVPDEIVVVGLASEDVPRATSQFAYDVGLDQWRELPAAPLNGQELALSWIPTWGPGIVVGVDYQNGAALYARETDSWRQLDPIPFRMGEGSVDLHWIGEQVLVQSTWGHALLHRDGQWTDVSDLPWAGTLVPIERGILSVGPQLALYVPDL